MQPAARERFEELHAVEAVKQVGVLFLFLSPVVDAPLNVRLARRGVKGMQGCVRLERSAVHASAEPIAAAHAHEHAALHTVVAQQRQKGRCAQHRPLARSHLLPHRARVGDGIDGIDGIRPKGD